MPTNYNIGLLGFNGDLVMENAWQIPFKQTNVSSGKGVSQSLITETSV